jgi:hypothetical protein
LGGLFFELTGDRMLLIEFKPDATTTISPQQLSQLYIKWNIPKTEIFKIPPEIFDSRQIFDVAGNLTLKKSELEPVIKRLHTLDNIAGFQGLLRIATSFEVWRHNPQAFSISRLFYALNFIAIITCGVQILALVMTIWLKPDSIFNKNKYLMYIVICELGILLWLPFQNYSVEHTKSLLFSPEFKGAVAGLNVLLYPIIFIIFPATISSIKRSATKKYQPILLSFSFVSFTLTLIGSWFGVSLIDHLFGMNSTNPLTPWFASSIFFAALFFFLFVRLIDHGVGDE